MGNERKAVSQNYRKRALQQRWETTPRILKGEERLAKIKLLILL